jgi:hypothetical protein
VPDTVFPTKPTCHSQRPRIARKAKKGDVINTYGGLPFPQADVALNVIFSVEGIQDSAIFNHGMRTYLYVRSLGHPGARYAMK